MTIRRENVGYRYWKINQYNIKPHFIYPNITILPELRKLGFTGDCGCITPLDLMKSIVSDNRAESLLKMKQLSVLYTYIYDKKYIVDRYWKSICICNRNRYRIKDASLWFDYMGYLEEERKDLKNSYYICPHRLKEAHQFYHERHTKRLEDVRRRKEEEKRLLDTEMKRRFEERIRKFADVLFKDNEIEVRVISSLEEMKNEGSTLRHCVYTSEYYKKESSLILSARIDSFPIATIELSLIHFNILQCRGKNNSIPPNYDRIVNLIERNINVIKKIIA